MRKFANLNEQVRVVKPLRFIRCGYPLTLQSIFERDPVAMAHRVNAACEAAGIDSYDPRTRDAMERLICSSIIRKENFGGRERSIHEIEVPELQGRVATVIGKQMVRTGTYSPGYSGYSYAGDYDAEPPYLAHVQTHCIYLLDVIVVQKDRQVGLSEFVADTGYVRIAAENCEWPVKHVDSAI